MKKDPLYPNIDNFNPSTCISGKMMKCNRIIANVFRKHLAPFHITDSQLSILFIITKANDTNQKKISDILYLEKSTVNRNLKRLLDNNYIMYTEGSYLSITDPGKVFLEELIPHWNTAMKELKLLLSNEGVNSLDFLSKQLSN